MVIFYRSNKKKKNIKHMIIAKYFMNQKFDFNESWLLLSD